MQTPFHAYIQARRLESEISENDFASVFASSDIRVYPFQIAAANFALRSPYQKGVVLCDESGMGKSHEAMLVVAQKWLEGQNKIFIAVPNADLLQQWAELIEKHYTVPFTVLSNSAQWKGNVSVTQPNGFIEDAIILTTYDFLAEYQNYAKAVKWDLCVFEEANALSCVYQAENKQAKKLKDIAEVGYKILLTGTPIEKNIMDLYGLMYFVDESVLPDEQTFLQRYLRKPENYPELSESVSKYCFRTLRKQAKQYALIPKRVPITLEYEPSKAEQKVYESLYAYIKKENKIAFPEMNQYDLSLRLLGLLGSSTKAIIATLDGVISRLKGVSGADGEIAELKRIRTAAQGIGLDEKARQLQKSLPKVFALLKKTGANKKAVIFTESVETQKYLYGLLKDKYKTVLYNGTTDYSALRSFKADGEILISTDNGARGFNLEEASFIVNYDLLYNTLKMEQRIDRCHRLNQQNDVITLAFMNKSNFAEVRKLELVNKRTLVSDGVFGVSDAVVGGFTDNLDNALKALETQLRPAAQVESDYIATLEDNKAENKQLVECAEDILFTTFTKSIADSVKVTPNYMEEKAKDLNNRLWQVAKFYFEQYNAKHTDCRYEIDDETRTVTATNYSALPMLFYYWSGNGNRRYYSQKKYGMAKDFKPSYGRITLTSIIGKGILQETECADSGELTVSGKIEPCEIALYSVTLLPQNKRLPKLVGVTQSGKVLSENESNEIMRLPVQSYKEDESKSVHWLRTSSEYNPIDKNLNLDELLAKSVAPLTKAQSEEVDKIKLRAKNRKSDLSRDIDGLQAQIKEVETSLAAVVGDRLQTLDLNRKLATLQRELKDKQESQFFEEMQFDLQTEKQIDEFLGKAKPTASAARQFILNVKGAIQ